MRGLLTLFATIIFIPAFSQRTCEITPYYETRGGGVITDSFRDTVPNEIITIPVVVHVLYNESHQNISDAQVNSQIAVLNEDFRLMNADASMVPHAFRERMADSRIMFCLAKVDPNGRSTSGINRKYTSVNSFMSADAMKFSASGGVDAWDTRRYLNIWVCSMFGRSLGYATMPGGPADKDGIVINFDVFGRTGFLRAPFNKGRTATHEVAHWLGLKHIWGDELCGDDNVDDTPEQKSYNYYCPTFPKMSTCSPDGNGDMYMNFMDLTDDACMNMFTQGQKTKMRSIFSAGNLRNGMLSSFVCDSSYATGGPLPTEPGPVQDVKPADVFIYPNPAGSFVNISPENDLDLTNALVFIRNVQGIMVQQSILKQSGNNRLDFRFLAPGIYFIKIEKDGFRKQLRLVRI